MTRINSLLTRLGLLARLLLLVGSPLFILSTLGSKPAPPMAPVLGLVGAMFAIDVYFAWKLRSRDLLRAWLLTDAALASNGALVLGVVAALRVASGNIGIVELGITVIALLCLVRLWTDLRYLRSNAFPKQSASLAEARDTIAKAWSPFTSNDPPTR